MLADKKLCDQHNITIEQLKLLLIKCSNSEIDSLIEGNFNERQKIINKYIL